jgi:phenylacetate-CoA ligase
MTTLSALEEFFRAGPVAAVGTGEPADGSVRALELFREAAASVPAYRAFLAGHGIEPDTVGDVAQLPLVTKKSYLHRHPLPQLCRDGTLGRADTVALSSGSSGEPTVWPRSIADEAITARRFEQILAGGFGAGERTTLVVICFALGSWVGGMYTAACCRLLAAKGYPITVATPGNNVDEILRAVRRLGPEYDQVVLAGYPPFVKGVVDAGLEQGVDWSAYAVKLVLAGEVFSEQWRDLVGRRAGITSAVAGSASMYGTADAGVLGTETPLSVGIRRFLSTRPDAARALFGDGRLPTLVQYDPSTRYFETHEGTLVLTADGQVPLIRYHLADEGGLVAYENMLDHCRAHGFDPLAGVGAAGAPVLPFVFVFGRSLFTVSYFGANIYPESVSAALERSPISEWSTGRFVVETRADEDENRVLSLTVEVAPGAVAGAAEAAEAAEAVRTELLRVNSEFAHYVPAGRQTPVVQLRPAGDPEYFPAGVKHRYSR